MPFGLSEANYALKRIYPKFPPQNIASYRHKFMAHTAKNGEWTGEENYKQGLEYGNPQGIGGDFVKAQTAAASSSTRGKAFDVPRRWKNGFAHIAGKAIVACGNDEGAFFRAVKHETDNGIRSFGDRLSVELLTGNGQGWIGRVQSINSTTVTLGIPSGQTQKWTALRFKESMTLNSSTDGTLANITAHSSQVQKVNYTAGTIVLSNVTNLSNGDYLAAAGDFEEGGCHGVSAWIPLAEPGDSDSFHGVNRSVNPTLLAGHRLPSTAANNSIKENALDLAADMETTGSLDDSGEKDGYLHPSNWNRLAKDLDTQVKRETDDGGFGFGYIEQESAAGTIKWFSEPDCDADRGYILTRSTWVIRHAMGFPHLNEDDGNAALRAPNLDSIEVRLRSAGNLFCLAAGGNGVFPITPPA